MQNVQNAHRSQKVCFCLITMYIFCQLSVVSNCIAVWATIVAISPKPLSVQQVCLACVFQLPN